MIAFSNEINMSLKIHILCASCLLVIVNGIPSDNSYTIGAIFHEDSGETETAFRCAIDTFNKYNNISFKANIRHVSKVNSFAVYRTVCEMLEEEKDGLAALFGPISSKVAGIVASLSSSLGIPNVVIYPPSSTKLADDTSVMSINIYPDVNLLQQGIAAHVKSFDWKSYAILYDHENTFTKLQHTLKLSEISPDKVIFRKLTPPDFRPALKEVKKLGYAQVIVDIDIQYITKLLEQAKELDMLGFLYSYFLTSLDAHILNLEHLDSLANITTIRMIDSDDKKVHDFLRVCGVGHLAFNYKNGLWSGLVKTEPSLMWDATNLFTTTFRELFVTQVPIFKKVTCEKIEEESKFNFRLANYIKIRPMRNMITGDIFFDNNVRSSLILQSVEMIQGSTTKTTYWNASNPETISFIRTEKEQQAQVDLYMQNITFIVSSKLGSPYLMKKNSTTPGKELEGNDRFEGYSFDIIDNVARLLNISYKFVLAADGKHGSFDRKKKVWNGLIKDLLDRKAHLAICDLTITEERRSAVDFSLPFMTLGVSILYSKPKPQERDMFAFLQPLDAAVWLYILVAYLSITFVMFFLARLAPGDWENPNPNDPNPEELENIWDLKNSFWLILGSTMSQGCDILPKGISSRMGTSMWWFLILIINSSYTANLSAFLTKSRMGFSINSAEDLAKQTKIKYGLLDGGSTQSFFKNSNFSTYQRMWNQMVQAKPTVFVKDNDEGVKRVRTTRNQLYAFLMESSSIEYVTERDCELKQVGGRLDNKGYGIAMPVNAPYRGAINYAILKMQEDGTLRRLKTRWWQEMYGGGSCKGESEAASDIQLAVANLGGVFLVLGVGICIAFLISFAEFIWNIHVVSLEEHRSYKETIISELKFAVCVWITVKKAHQSSTSNEELPSNLNGSHATSKSYESGKDE